MWLRAISGEGLALSPSFDPPIVVNVRDRVSPLRKLVDWLERAGHERITLLDNDSTYPELLTYLTDSPHNVVRLGQNLGSRALWLSNRLPTEPYIYTDPDILPIEECPLDAVERFKYLLDRVAVPKVGFGLHIDDLPADWRHREWETGPQIRGMVVREGAYISLIDTTFALYRPGIMDFRYQAVRTGFPYEARHLSQSWYGGEITAEERYYLDRAIQGPAGSSWAQVAA